MTRPASDWPTVLRSMIRTIDRERSGRIAAERERDRLAERLEAMDLGPLLAASIEAEKAKKEGSDGSL